jgi:hypothetical protein
MITMAELTIMWAGACDPRIGVRRDTIEQSSELDGRRDSPRLALKRSTSLMS